MIVYYTYGSKKNSMVERLNRTLKERLERYFYENKTKNWINVLTDFTNNINHSVNRTLGIPPISVTFENSPKLWKKMYPNQSLKPKCDAIRVGDRVRTILPQNIFAKGYAQAWSTEIYTVDSIQPSMGLCLYTLKDNDGNVSKKRYYISELNFVSRNVSTSDQ